MPAPEPCQSVEMSDALQDPEMDMDYVPASPRRVDTEMGGKAQASSLEGRAPYLEPQRRSTFPPPIGQVS